MLCKCYKACKDDIEIKADNKQRVTEKEERRKLVFQKNR